jgi:catalase
MRHHNPPDPVYAPNSFGGPKADPSYELPNWQVEAGEIARTAHLKHAEDDDFGQPGTLYREVLSETDRDHLVTNIVNHLKGGAKPDMQQRAVEYWTKVDANLGARIRATLDGNRDGRKADRAAAEGNNVTR